MCNIELRGCSRLIYELGTLSYGTIQPTTLARDSTVAFDLPLRKFTNFSKGSDLFTATITGRTKWNRLGSY